MKKKEDPTTYRLTRYSTRAIVFYKAWHTECLSIEHRFNVRIFEVKDFQKAMNLNRNPDSMLPIESESESVNAVPKRRK